jgi:hypothetical protein
MMMIFLKKLKKTRLWCFVVDFIIYPFYHFFWSYFLNFNAKLLYFLWNFKKRDFYALDNNDKKIIFDDDFKILSKKILKELDDKTIFKFKQVLINTDYASKVKKFNQAASESPYVIEMYNDLSSELKSKIVKFASSDKMISTACSYLKIFPILTRVQVYLNIPRENNNFRGPMLWHKDGFGFKNLDFFMCVTDVDDDNGPFFCLKKKIKSGVFKSFDYFFTRTGERKKVPLEVFDKIFSNNEVIKFVGKSGTGMFLDSFSNYHRGGFCKSKDRIMLRFCYQSQDAICDRFEENYEFFPYDSSIKKINTNDVFKKFLFFKMPSLLLKKIKKKFLWLYSVIEFRY